MNKNQELLSIKLDQAVNAVKEMYLKADQSKEMATNMLSLFKSEGSEVENEMVDKAISELKNIS